ncbi:MAG: hypothetical protein LUG98_09775 [Tannerellaceae bacterium]|nr:hypothetical protein [Tannerellaceae bacterium]
MKKWLLVLFLIISVAYLLFAVNTVWPDRMGKSSTKDTPVNGRTRLVLEIDYQDALRSLLFFSYASDESFNKALEAAVSRKQTGKKDFVDLFAEEYRKLNEEVPLAALFSTYEMRDRITDESSDTEVIQVLKEELETISRNTYLTLLARLSRFGMEDAIPEYVNKGRFLITLPGVKDTERIHSFLLSKGNLEFWETFDCSEIFSALESVDHYLASIRQQAIQEDEAGLVLPEDENPLFYLLNTAFSQGVDIGYAEEKDIDKLNEYFSMPQVKDLLPRNLIFKWSAKPLQDNSSLFKLYDIKSTYYNYRPPLTGEVIIDTRSVVDTYCKTDSYLIDVLLNKTGTEMFAKLTRDNIGREIAIVLDNRVCCAPIIQDEITGGYLKVSGDFSKEEAEDLAAILKTGSLAAAVCVLEEEIFE